MADGVGNRCEQLLVFRLDDQRYALRLETVARIVRAVAVTPLPEAPDDIHGIINLKGRIVSTLSLRHRFALPAKEMRRIIEGRTWVESAGEGQGSTFFSLPAIENDIPVVGKATHRED